MASTDLLSQLEVARQNWAAFDWTSQQASMGETLSNTAKARESAVSARKQLSENTKQFKRVVKTLEQTAESLSNEANPDNVAAACKAVEAMGKQSRTTVKSYQEEIDNLTRRCKTSESTFGGLAAALSELPDPAAFLTVAMEQMQAQQQQQAQLLLTVEQVNAELQTQTEANANYKKEIAILQKSGGGSSSMSKADHEELIQLRREVAEYEVEFRSLKNQDITIRKLEAKIAELQSAGEEQMKVSIEKAKEELAETEGRRVAEALQREAAMERKVAALELQLKAERAGREATQADLLEVDEGVSQREAAWEAQRSILMDDAERLRESLQVASRERDELRLRVAALEGRSGTVTPPPSTGISMSDLMLERKAYESEVAELSETAAILREELRQKEESLTEERSQFQSTISSLERETADLNARINELESQLSVAPSQQLVDSMKRELAILKRLEYNADEFETDRDPEIAGGNEEKDLESVLVAKLRRAESELVTERTSRSDLSMQVNALKLQLEETEEAKEAADRLVFSLERDLERAISTPSAPSKGRKKSETPMMLAESNPATLQSVLDPEASPPPVEATPPRPVLSASAAEKADDDNSVATIVMAQRDRLRARCEALEAERDSFKRELQAQVSASESLKADNTKLYEKVRYLQNFNSGPGNRATRRSMAQDRDLDLEALEQRYEASVDPFRQFGKAERQRKLNEMSPIERTVFIVAKTFLGTKEMRMALVFYVVAMHLLVFVTTYHWSHTGGCHNFDAEHLAHLPPAIPQHIREQMAEQADAAGSAAADAVSP